MTSTQQTSRNSVYHAEHQARRLDIESAGVSYVPLIESVRSSVR